MHLKKTSYHYYQKVASFSYYVGLPTVTTGKNIHVIAHSFGCVLAIELARRWSDRVQSLTLLAPAFFLSEEDVVSHLQSSSASSMYT